jgi:hypothetical protein
MNRVCSLAGRKELTDKTKYESIRILNAALMERLGEVSGELKKAQQAIETLTAENERYQKREDEPPLGAEDEPEPRPTPAEKKAMDPPLPENGAQRDPDALGLNGHFSPV